MMVNTIPIRFVVAAVAIITLVRLVTPVGHGQAFPLASHVTAIVFDESGAVIPDSELVFRSDSKEIVSHTGTDGSVTVSLQNGRYSVAITKLGFVKTEVRDVQVPMSETLRIVMKVAPTPINGPDTVSGLYTITSDLPNVVPEPTRVPTWHYPDDRSAIRLQKPAKPYSAEGLPDGIVAVLTKYRQSGLRVPRPEGHGYWKFEKVSKLYYKGQLFALVGNATGISEDGHDLGWVTGLVIYDENGDGKLDSPEGINDGTDRFVFHLPKWVKR
jgi:carboxypeptidase family protein